jgi:hypothetical protein
MNLLEKQKYLVLLVFENFLQLGMEPQALHMLGKLSTTVQHHQP